MENSNPTPPVESNPTGSAPIQTPPAVVSPIAPEVPGKKSNNAKIGLIAGAAVLLAGGIGGGTYAYIQTRPENVMAGTFANFVKSENIAMAGSVRLSSKEFTEASLGDINLKFDYDTSKNGDVATGFNVTLSTTIKLSEGKTHDVSITSNEVTLKDGVFYFKLSGIKKTIESLSDDIALTLSDAESTILDAVTTIENTWWRVSVNELVDDFGEQLGIDAEKQNIKDAYSCLVNQMRTEANKTTPYIDLFKKYPFINLIDANSVNQSHPEKANYALKFDGDKVISYVNESEKIFDTDAIATCLKKVSFLKDMINTESDTELSEAEKTEIKEFVSKLPTIFLNVDSLGHQLKNAYVDYDGSEFGADVELSFAYPSKISETAPTESKSISELYTVVAPIVEVFLSELSDTSIDAPVVYDYPAMDNNLDSFSAEELEVLQNMMQ